MTRFPLAALVGLCAGLLAGCSDPYAGRYAVSGKVTLKGQPLSNATITFTPEDAAVGTTSGSSITDGTYTIERQHGLKPGKYLVRITAGDGKNVANEEEAGAPGGSTNIISVDRIPPEWNVRSDKHVEVSADKPNQFDFDVPNEYVPKSKKKR